LAEIAPPELAIPGMGRLGELLQQVDVDGVWRLG